MEYMANNATVTQNQEVIVIALSSYWITLIECKENYLQKLN